MVLRRHRHEATQPNSGEHQSINDMWCYVVHERRSSVVDSTPAWHAGDLGSIPARTRRVILGVKTRLSTLDLETVYRSVCIS